MDFPEPVLISWWALVGLCVGSFLNVAIHRLPREGESITRPRRSRCPQCKRELEWRDNVPVLSWVLLGGKCRTCRWPIPWRYPLVEVLTAVLFVLAYRATPDGAWGLLVIRSVVLSGIVVATFVDFDFYEIPDEVSIGGMIVAPLASLLVPELHAATSVAVALSGDGGVDRVGALLGSLAGLAVGGGSLLLLGWVGKRIYGREAMGLGDVKLLAAGGGFVGPGGALVGLLLGALLASVVGPANMTRFLCLSRRRARARKSSRSWWASLRTARIAGRYLPFGPYLGIGIGIALLGWNHVSELLTGLVSGRY